MAFADLPLVGMLKTRMRWLESRQKLLAENVANADTPGYRERDLKPIGFSELLAGSSGGSAMTGVAANPMHIAIHTSDGAGFSAGKMKTFETTPNGNSVVVEDEMMKVAETQQDYQVATMLYTKSLNLIKMAGRRG
jgi:flagellar basal-body rod protein FlgB